MGASDYAVANPMNQKARLSDRIFKDRNIRSVSIAASRETGSSLISLFQRSSAGGDAGQLMGTKVISISQNGTLALASGQ
jgi:hypothetical protein